MKRIFLIIILSLFLFEVSIAQWQQANGPYGGCVMTLEVDTTTNNLYAGTFSGGVFISGNNGESWSSRNSGISNSGLFIKDIAIKGNYIFAGTYRDGIYLSANNGNSWTPVNTGLTNLSVQSLAISGNYIFAGTGGGMFVSVNNGNSWTEINNGLEGITMGVFSIALRGEDTFAGTGDGIYLSTDNGNSWRRIKETLEDEYVSALAVNGHNIFAGTTTGGIIMSSDNGNHWDYANNGLVGSNVKAIVINGSKVFAGTLAGGINVSLDSGSSWSRLNTGLINLDITAIALSGVNMFAGTIAGIFRSTNEGNWWYAVNNGLSNTGIQSINVSGSNVITGAWDGGAFISYNNGSIWNVVNTGLSAKNSWGWQLNTFAINGSNIFAGTDVGIFFSNNYGSSWTAVNNGLSESALNVRTIAVSGSNIFAGTWRGGVYLSTNNGNTWTPVNTGLSGSALTITAIVAAGDDIFAGTNGSGIYLSEDNGNSWEPMNNGLAGYGLYVSSLAFDGNNIFAGTGSGIFKSTSKGGSWISVNTGLPDSWIQSLVINGSDILVRTSAHEVFLSRDKGISWVDTDFSQIPNFSNGTGPTAVFTYPIGINEHYIFSGSSGNGVWRRPLSNFVYLTLSTDSLNINSLDNSKATFDISSTTNWTVTSDQVWLVPDINSGYGDSTVTLTAQYNPSGSVRVATITVSGIDVNPHTITVTQNGSPLAGQILTQVNVDCYGSNTGRVIVEASGGLAPYEFRINAGAYQSSGTFGSLTAGNYTITIRDSNITTFEIPITISEPESGLSGSLSSIVNVSTFEGYDGQVTITGAGGAPPYEYSLNSGTYQSSGVFGSLSAGSYIITIRDANLCLFDLPVVITQPHQPFASVATSPVSSITLTTAICGGIITDNGGNEVSDRGVCWSTSHLPTTDINKTDDGTGTGAFTSSITGLIPNTTYYLRAYATNSSGTAYGEELSFRTLDDLLNIDDCLIRWYPFDGNSDEETGFGNDGILNGASPADDRFGNPASALYFNGVDNSITIPGNLPIANSFTISFWAFLERTDGYSNIISDGSIDYGGNDFLINFRDNSIGIRADKAGFPLNYEYDSPAEMTNLGLANRWAHVAWVMNPSGSLIYLDGVKIAEVNVPGTNEGFHDDHVTIGARHVWTSMDSFFQGRLDELRVYNCELTDQQISYIYNDNGSGQPSVSTASVTNITDNSATSGGYIFSDGGFPVTARGVCWSTSTNPTISDNLTLDGSGKGSFTSTVSGLVSGTRYFLRSYATNSQGTSYGKEINFLAGSNPFANCGRVTDVDGNVYNTVTIGSQCWMQENLKTTRFKDGSIIPLVADSVEWNHLSTPGYCWNNNDEANNKDVYGAVYNWYSVNTGKLCPAGWHVPTSEEWDVLANYLGGHSVAGGKLKEAGTDHWSEPNTGATNETGFTALPGGGRQFAGSFLQPGEYGHWWCSPPIGTFQYTETKTLNTIFSSLSSFNGYDERIGMSVRCLQGEPVTPPKLNTINVSSLTFSSAVSGGNITSDGGAPVTERGVCWDMSPNPTIYHNRTFDGTGPGAFTSPITGLMPGTTYFIRAYATNSSGTAYGNEIIFTTEFPVLIFDGSGNNCVGSRSYLRLEIFGATPPFTVNLIRNGEIQPPVTGYMPGSEIETGFLEPGIHVFEIMSVMEAESNSIPPHAFPSPYSLEIYDLPDASPSSNNLPVICNDGVTDITLRSGSANCDFIYTATYSPSVTWLPGKSPESGVRFNGEGSRLEQNLAHTSNQPVVVTYTIMPQITGTSSCIGIPAIINVTVAPEVNISPVTDMILCNGEASPPVVFTTVNTGALYTYTWTSSNASIGLPASGTGFIPSFVAVNTADSPLLSTITVTPHYNSGPVLCQGVSQNFNIIVNPTPRVVPVNIEPEICSGEYMQIQLTSPTVFTTGMTTFDYSVSAPEGITGNADPGTGIAPGEDLSFQYSNNTDTVQTVWFYITPKNESLGCIGNPVIQEVRVHPTPVQGIHLIRPFTCEESTGRAAIHAELSEGAEPYRISWQGPVGFFAEDQVDIDDLIAGYYTVRVTDRLGCTNDAAINVQNLSASPRIVPYPILPDINISCAGGDDGTARIYVRSGVTAPYFYTLLHNETDSVCSGFFSDVYNPSDPSTYRVCEGLTAGLYELKILDINGCETIRLTKLNEPEPLSMQFTVSDYNGTNVTCPGYNDGYINTSLIGGLGILVYNWTGPGGFSSTAKDISGLAAGEYTLTVTDAMGCSLTRSLILTGPEPLDAVVDHVDIYCHGSNNGTIRISEPQGGSGTFEFSIKGGSDWHSIMEFSGLGQGIYDVRMRDALSSGCEMILDSSLVILEPSGLTAILSSTNVSCYGGNNGIINITAASGGYGSHEFSINGGLSWSASGLFQYLAPGVYNVQMRDGDHPECIVILDPALTISEPAELSATLYSTDLSCSGTNDGTITISMPVGGHGTYHFSIDRGTTWHTSGHFTGLTTGTYNVQIRDAVQPGCFRILNELLIISQPEHLSAIVRKTDISCGNDGDGTILIESPSGGYGSYEYTIDGGSTWNASGLFDELESGLYDVRMRDRANPACYIVLNPALEIFPSGDATLTSNLNPSAICSGSRFVYDATSSIIEATLDWTRPAIEGLVEPAGSGTGNIDEVLTNLTSEPLDVIYLYTVAHGDCSNTSIVTVTVYPAPRARAGGSQIVCIGDSVNVSGTSYSGGIINWKCYGNGGFSGSETLNPTYTPVPSDAGKTILLTMTVTGTGSCSHMSDSAHYWVIVREPQTITFNTLAEKVYGDPSFELTASSSSSLDVNFTCNNDSVIVISGKTVTIKGAGTATIYAHQSGNDFYCPALPVSLTITIDPKPISVMADTALTKTYGDADPVLSYSVYPGLAGTDKLQGNLSREDGENAGRNYVIYQGTLNAGPDYNMTFIPGRMFINPKPVTVTPNPGQNKTYGSDDPVLEFMIDPDLVKGDVVSGALTRSPGENAGSYLIKRGTLSLGNNYSLIYFPGYFTINKAFLTVIVDRKERTYLENNPEFGISLLGFVRGEDERVVDTLPSLDPLPDAMSDAGEYVITASGGLDNNYSFNYLNGSLTINKAKQEILSFNPLPKFLRTTQRFPLEASSSSGLAVTFVSSDADKATIEDDVLTIIKEGAVNIYAIQEGDKNWNPAPAIYQTVIGQPTFDNVTSLFTPNSDGMNDHWHIVNIEDFGAVEVKVYNRFGKLVYESSDYKNDWKGDFNGSPLPEASYYYIIKSAKKGVVKGVVNIVR